MKDKLIEYETAKLAKEKEFKLKIESRQDALSGLYSNVEILPTQSLLQRWLREVHKISVCPELRQTEDRKVITWLSNIHRIPYKDFTGMLEGIGSKTYEEAFEAGLVYGLNMIGRDY